MDLASLAIVGLMTIAVLLVVLLPAWIAWLVAWRSSMPIQARRSFMFICLLLTFGIITLAGVLLIPLQMAATWVAPELHTGGNKSLANAIYVASEHGIPIACLVTGIFSSVFVPLKLRHMWPAIQSAINANNPFKPNPLRGSA